MIRPAYLSKASLATALDVSESSIDEYVRTGKIPKPVRLSAGCVRWRWDSVDAALASLPAQINPNGPVVDLEERRDETRREKKGGVRGLA